MQVNVLGAGIAGPTAALAFAKHGHEVSVYEARKREDVKSGGIIGISQANVNSLTELRVPIEGVALDSSYSEWDWDTNKAVTSRTYSGVYVVWTDLHEVITRAATDAGATFEWGHDGIGINQPFGSLTIDARGVSAAASYGNTPAYAGYVVYRGMSNLDTDYAWLAVSDIPRYRFAFKLGHTPYGASWEMYVPRPEWGTMRSLQVDPTLQPDEMTLLPEVFADTLAATYELAVAPISDWVQGPMDHTPSFWTVGDSNGGMRPQSGSGANLAIAEALTVPELTLHPNALDEMKDVITTRMAYRWQASDQGMRVGQQTLGL